MNILFMVLDAGAGGHMRSCFTIGTCLSQTGEEILLVTTSVDKQLFTRNANNLKIVKLPTRYRNPIFDIILFFNICRIIKRNNCQLITTFDLHSHILGYFIAKILGLPCISVICGGTIKYHYPYTRPVIVFSEELKNIMERKLGFAGKDIIVEPARVTKPVISHKHNSSLIQSLKKTGIKEDVKKILMVARISWTKINSILYMMNVCQQLAKVRSDFIFLLVGKVQDKEVFRIVKDKIGAVVSEIGKEIIFFNEGLERYIPDCIYEADIVVGVGRVCWEAMALEKPVIVVGESGFAGFISPKMDKNELQRIMFYNFSGRNVDKRNLMETKHIVEVINILMDNREFAEECGRIGSELFREVYDVKNGITTYKRIMYDILNNGKQKMDALWYPIMGYIILFGGNAKGLLRRIVSRLVTRTSEFMSE